MKTTNLVGAGFLAVCISLIGCGQEPDVATEVSFANDVLPILETNCVECHDLAAEGVATSGLNLRDYEGVMQGTRSDVVAVPNSSESSALYLVVAHQTDPEIQMPPEHRDALAEGRVPSLNEKEIKTIQDWVDQGALDN
jgi:Planctomycete cytochrome C